MSLPLPDHPSLDAAVRAFDAMSAAARNALRLNGQGRLVGRVVSEPRPARDHHWWIDLADEVSSFSINARVPLSAEGDAPVQGAIVELAGRFLPNPYGENLALKLEFLADSLTVRRFPAPFVPSGHQPARLTAPMRSLVLVTGRGSLAEADFRKAIEGRGLHELAAAMRLEYVRLEDGPVTAIVEAIHRAGSARPDLLVLARGGGDAAVINRFGHPDLVAAVRNLTRDVPVMVAVGHAKDRVGAEQVASYVATTPSDAGHQVAQLQLELVEAAEHRRRRQRRVMVANAILALALGLGLFFGGRWAWRKAADAWESFWGKPAVEESSKEVVGPRPRVESGATRIREKRRPRARRAGEAAPRRPVRGSLSSP